MEELVVFLIQQLLLWVGLPLLLALLWRNDGKKRKDVGNKGGSGGCATPRPQKTDDECLREIERELRKRRS